jgi:hypothetical protein
VSRKRHLAARTGTPVVAQYTDVDADAYTVMPDGRLMQRTVFGLTEDQVGRIRAGYTCLKCLEDHNAPFPDECTVCRFPMRDKQAEEFAKDFRGNIRFGPSTSLDEERGIMNEMREREARERALALGISIVKPQVIIPRDV